MNVPVFCHLCAGYMGSLDIESDTLAVQDNMRVLCTSCWNKLKLRVKKPHIVG